MPNRKQGVMGQQQVGILVRIDIGAVANVVTFPLQVDGEPIRVLYLEGAMRYEFKFLKARLEDDPDLIAVGGVFYGENGCGLVGQLQRNEYTRYQRDISRRQGRVFVLTGTASLPARSVATVRSGRFSSRLRPASQRTVWLQNRAYSVSDRPTSRGVRLHFQVVSARIASTFPPP